MFGLTYGTRSLNPRANVGSLRLEAGTILVIAPKLPGGSNYNRNRQGREEEEYQLPPPSLLNEVGWRYRFTRMEDPTLVTYFLLRPNVPEWDNHTPYRPKPRRKVVKVDEDDE